MKTKKIEVDGRTVVIRRIGVGARMEYDRLRAVAPPIAMARLGTKPGDPDAELHVAKLLAEDSDGKIAAEIDAFLAKKREMAEKARLFLVCSCIVKIEDKPGPFEIDDEFDEDEFCEIERAIMEFNPKISEAPDPFGEPTRSSSLAAT